MTQKKELKILKNFSGLIILRLFANCSAYARGCPNLTRSLVRPRRTRTARRGVGGRVLPGGAGARGPPRRRGGLTATPDTGALPPAAACSVEYRGQQERWIGNPEDRASRKPMPILLEWISRCASKIKGSLPLWLWASISKSLRTSLPMVTCAYSLSWFGDQFNTSGIPNRARWPRGKGTQVMLPTGRGPLFRRIGIILRREGGSHKLMIDPSDRTRDTHPPPSSRITLLRQGGGSASQIARGAVKSPLRTKTKTKTPFT